MIMGERLNGHRESQIPVVTLPYWEEGKALVLNGKKLVDDTRSVLETGESFRFLFSRDTRDDDIRAAGIVEAFLHSFAVFSGKIEVVPDEELGGYLRIQIRNGRVAN